MVRKHELKGGEGSISIGATGKVSALMMQELDSIKVPPKTHSRSCKRRFQTAPVSISCSVSTKRLQQWKASSNSSKNIGRMTNSSHHRTQGSIQRKKEIATKTSQNIPILSSEDIYIDSTPGRGKPEKKRSQIVEIVDLKCGKPDGAWSSPISSQLRRLSFSKISD